MAPLLSCRGGATPWIGLAPTDCHAAEFVGDSRSGRDGREGVPTKLSDEAWSHGNYRREETSMAESVYKVIELVGTSEESWRRLPARR